MITDENFASAKKLWDYHHVNHKLKRSDCILVLGSHDVRVGERGAELLLQGWAPVLILSGGLGRLTKNMWLQTEAEKFASLAEKMGVPKEAILVENRSTNTGENILFTKQLLEEKQLHYQRFIVVQKPYMERRSLATFQKQWAGKELIITSPQIAFEDYPNDDISMDEVINIMVGDLQRIKVYPEKGFQTFQEIPEDVWNAYEKLVDAGYNKYLVKQ